MVPDWPAVARAWLMLTAALALHVADEAAHDFLAIYNPAARQLRELYPWLPLPTFSFAAWLGGLMLATAVLSFLGIRSARGGPWVQPLGLCFGGFMLGNGLLHLAGSLLRHQLLPGTISAAAPRRGGLPAWGALRVGPPPHPALTRPDLTYPHPAFLRPSGESH